MRDIALILPAAGRSTRFHAGRHPETAPLDTHALDDLPPRKVFLDLDGAAVWVRTLTRFANRPDLARVLVAVCPEDRSAFERHFAIPLKTFGVEVVEGGAERFETVARALDHLRDDPTIALVAVHDAARPCVPPDRIEAVFQAARHCGAAALAVPVADTLRRIDAEGFAAGVIDRTGVVAMQTPQVFRRDWLIEAHDRHRQRLANHHDTADSLAVTDDVQLVEALGKRCALVPGHPANLKITTPRDFELARALLRAETSVL